MGITSFLVFVTSGYLFFQLEHETTKVFLLFFAGSGAMITFALVFTAPQLKRAARATRTGRRYPCNIDLRIDDSGPDDPVLTGSFQEGCATWCLKFSKPVGWAPESGTQHCEIVFLSGEKTPALGQLEHGILIPTENSSCSYKRST